MDSKMILLVEDNPNDEALTLRAFRKNNIDNTLIIEDSANGLQFLLRELRRNHCEIEYEQVKTTRSPAYRSYRQLEL